MFDNIRKLLDENPMSIMCVAVMEKNEKTIQAAAICGGDFRDLSCALSNMMKRDHNIADVVIGAIVNGADSVISVKMDEFMKNFKKQKDDEDFPFNFNNTGSA